MRKAWNKIEWTDEAIEYLKSNFYSKTNPELANALGLKITSVRTMCYSLGLKRMEFEYWTPEMVNFYTENYKTMGDKEMIAVFEEKYPKNRPWTVKHFAKKRNYLGLHRTKEDLYNIMEKAKENGVYACGSKKTWKTRGVTPNGVIRYWKNRPYIKIDGVFVNWARYVYENTFGKVGKGMNVVFANKDPRDLRIENLILLTDAELVIFGATSIKSNLPDGYVAKRLAWKDKDLQVELLKSPEIIEAKRNLIKLKNTIKNARQTYNYN